MTLFCDLFANVAPTPDPTVLAITNSAVSTAARRERRTRPASLSSETMAAGGGGLVDLGRTAKPNRPRRGNGPGQTPDQHVIANG